MPFEWDDTKRAANLEKHDVDFADVVAFDWGSAIVLADHRADYGETRWIAIGPLSDRVHVAVFVLRGQAVRLISLRRANRAEGKRYAESIQAR